MWSGTSQKAGYFGLRRSQYCSRLPGNYMLHFHERFHLTLVKRGSLLAEVTEPGSQLTGTKVGRVNTNKRDIPVKQEINH